MEIHEYTCISSIRAVIDWKERVPQTFKEIIIRSSRFHGRRVNADNQRPSGPAPRTLGRSLSQKHLEWTRHEADVYLPIYLIMVGTIRWHRKPDSVSRYYLINARLPSLVETKAGLCHDMSTVAAITEPAYTILLHPWYFVGDTCFGGHQLA